MLTHLFHPQPKDWLLFGMATCWRSVCLSPPSTDWNQLYSYWHSRRSRALAGLLLVGLIRLQWKAVGGRTGHNQ